MPSFEPLESHFPVLRFFVVFALEGVGTSLHAPSTFRSHVGPSFPPHEWFRLFVVRGSHPS